MERYHLMQFIAYVIRMQHVNIPAHIVENRAYLARLDKVTRKQLTNRWKWLIKVSQDAPWKSDVRSRYTYRDDFSPIFTNCAAWMFHRAYVECINAGKKASPARMAMKLQAWELKMMRLTDTPKELSDVENVYDGTLVTPEDRFGKAYDEIEWREDREYNYTQLTGTRGFNGIRKLPAIPSQRAASMDEGLRSIRHAMLTQYRDNVSLHYKARKEAPNNWQGPRPQNTVYCLATVHQHHSRVKALNS